jgi:hypothetical protein
VTFFVLLVAGSVDTLNGKANLASSGVQHSSVSFATDALLAQALMIHHWAVLSYLALREAVTCALRL